MGFKDDIDLQLAHDFCRFTLLITSVYLLLVELSAIIKQRVGYFNSLPKLFNIITPILILSNAFDTEESVKFWTV